MMTTLGILLLVSSTSALHEYEVKVIEHSTTPVLSSANAKGHGAAPPGCIVFNPSFIPSSPSFNQSGLLVRLCCGSSCTGHGSDVSSSSFLADDGLPAERIGFAPCDLHTGVCGDVLPSSVFNLDPASDSEDPRAYYHDGMYYNFYYRKRSDAPQRCKGDQCTVKLAKSPTPLDAASWQEVTTLPWHRNGCCALKNKFRDRVWCIWGEGPDPFPGLGISHTADLDSGTFTQGQWDDSALPSASRNSTCPLSADRRWFLPYGASREEVKLEAAAPLVELQTGDLLHFYAAATPGWVPNGNYTAGFVVLDRRNPARILQRSDRHVLIPTFDYETLCGGDPSCKYRGERKNVIFLSSATAMGTQGTNVDRVRLFFGGGDGNVGTAIVDVVARPKKR